MISVPRRLMTRYVGPVWVVIAAFLFSWARTATGDPADDELVDDAPLMEPELEISDAAVYGRVFGDGADRVAGCEQLDTLLRQKIAIVDRVCGLTNSQKQKLQLAGRGDSTRLFDRIDMIGARIQLARHDREKIYHLLDDAQSLQHDLIRPGLSSDGSLFFKSLERLLSVEQSIKYAPLRAIVRAGGLVRVRWDGARELLEISLPGTTFVDEKLVNLHELPGPHVLVLAKSQVTDAGLVHLAGLTSLQTLVLNKTRVTDKGLAELKGLTGLRELALDETPVTDAGLEHVQGLTGLQHISVKATGVSDAGLAHLKGLNRLESLVLDETEVTDAGLVHLKGLTNLQLLLVRRTTVTNSGVAQLKRTLPRLAIHK